MSTRLGHKTLEYVNKERLPSSSPMPLQSILGSLKCILTPLGPLVELQNIWAGYLIKEIEVFMLWRLKAQSKGTLSAQHLVRVLFNTPQYGGWPHVGTCAEEGKSCGKIGI